MLITYSGCNVDAAGLYFSDFLATAMDSLQVFWLGLNDRSVARSITAGDIVGIHKVERIGKTMNDCR